MPYCGKNATILLLLLALFALDANTEFTADFEDFLVKRYGNEVAYNLARRDLGNFFLGSFGGKPNSTVALQHRPVIFVHGVTQRAGGFVAHRFSFQMDGYNPWELYATSWGDGGLTAMYNEVLKCAYAKQVRQFIIAVSEYTSSEVDVIGYSMGAAVSRKAILGGPCVDTKEDLGEALTNRINTYVALAGVVHGIEYCPDQFLGCNRLNGFKCDSEYLKELNTQTQRFEGKTSYSVYSVDDTLVGQNCCGSRCSELPNANFTIARNLHSHASIFYAFEDIQSGFRN
uniref:Lipase domain-containing protein n=1 Tax=Steinernema glaseri TaxID=37863 RepID=A0A1I8ASG2_9BILA